MTHSKGKKVLGYFIICLPFLIVYVALAWLTGMPGRALIPFALVLVEVLIVIVCTKIGGYLINNE